MKESDVTTIQLGNASRGVLEGLAVSERSSDLLAYTSLDSRLIWLT